MKCNTSKIVLPPCRVSARKGRVHGATEPTDEIRGAINNEHENLEKNGLFYYND